MNDAPMKQAEAPAGEQEPAELSTPQFDDIAVLMAQPVEPIATRQREWFAVLEKPRTLIAIMVIGALLGTTAVALTLKMRQGPPVYSAASPAVPVEQPSAQTEAPMGSSGEKQESAAGRTRVRKVQPRTVIVSERPVARRVGVIHYGSTHRPN